VNRLPVVDDQQRLVGIVTRADIVRGLFPEA
jgi:CBS domain-containing protein